MIRKLLFLLSISLFLFVVACGGQGEAPMVAESETAPAAPEPVAIEPLRASVTLQGREGSEVGGEVVFEETEDGVSIRATVSGLEPGTTHGFHVHDIGDCSAADFTSSGGHFNPTEVDHAGPDAEVHHAGDLGNIVAGEDGMAQLEGNSSMLTVSVGEGSVVGRAVILHEKEDDLTSQPTGAAGSRIACGVVELAPGE